MNKRQKKNKAKELLHKDQLTFGDKVWLISIFKNHPDYYFKCGQGANDIVRMDTEYRTKCFGILRVDGSIVDISYNVSIDGEHKNLKLISMACRDAIKEEIKNVRYSVNYGVDLCPFNYVPLTRDNTHIDHYDMKFRDVVNAWLKTQKVSNLLSYLNPDIDTFETSVYFTDDSINDDFVKFHNANTHLRAISKEANLRLH